MKSLKLFPNPGTMPSKPEPKQGSKIRLKIDGYPPYKDVKYSIRNPKHKHHDRFIILREEAYLKMRGPKWYDGPIEMNLEIYAPKLEDKKGLNDYVGGIMDTLDGSHGQYFTYLPVAYQDDCQVALGSHRFIESSEFFYYLEIIFLEYEDITKKSFTYYGPVSR
jgi:hypothetical protein